MSPLFSLAVPDLITVFLPSFILVALAAGLFHLSHNRFRHLTAKGVLRAYVHGPWFLATLGAVVFAATVYSGELAKSVSVDIDVDMRISDGQNVELYVNEGVSAPLRLPVVRDARRSYRFAHVPNELGSIRLDPTEAPGARISLYGLSVIADGKVIRSFSPADLKSWTMSNVSEVSGDAGSLNLVSTTNDPILSLKTPVIALERPFWVIFLTGLFQRDDLFSLAFIFFFLMFLLCGISTARGSLDASVVAVLAAAAFPVAVLAARIPVSPPPVESAIGNAAYFGYPKLRDHLISFAMVAAAAVIAWLSARLIALPGLPPDERREERPVNVWMARLMPAAVLFVLIIHNLPDLRGQLEQLKLVNAPAADWDSQNAALWEYLIHQGYLPFRDFWYPYAGFYANLLPFPKGVLVSFLDSTLTLWFLYLGFRYTARRAEKTALFLFTVVLLPVWFGAFPGWFRYILALNVVLFYAAVQESKRLEPGKQLAFAALSGFVFFYEPVQLMYAAAGIIAHTVFAAWPKGGLTAGRQAVRAQAGNIAKQRLAFVVLPMAAGILPVLIFLTASGMLPGFIRFHATLSDSSASSSLPADVVRWTLPVLQFDTIFMVVFFGLVLGLAMWFRNRTLNLPSVALLASAFAGVMAMQKQIVRPHVMAQLQVFAYFAVVLYGLSIWHRRTVAQRAVVVMFAGFLVGMTEIRGEWQSFSRTAERVPATLAGDYDTLIRQSSTIGRLNKERYDSSRRGASGVEGAVITALKNDFGWNGRDRVFVLGDDPAFYILLQQEAPYVANNYNCSPLSEQEHVLEWLRGRRPRFVLWNPSKDSYDGVPHVVRVPIVYQYVVENYRHVRSIGPYEILMTVRERPGADPQYWKQKLGAGVDLGSIPRLTRASRYHPCTAGSAKDCRLVVVVHASAGTRPRKATALIDSAAGAFQVKFDLAVGERDYLIDLDRLWFRSFLGPEPRVAIPEFSPVLASRSRNDGVLY